MMRQLAGIAALTLACSQSPAFGQDDDLASLALADQTIDLTADAGAPPPAWRGFIEGAASVACPRGAHCGDTNQRLSLNLGLDQPLAPGLRIVAENRLDLNRNAQQPFPRNANSLKEAYLDWRATDRLMFTAGRINLRYGLAQSYSPNDVFRAHTLRTLVSLDPAANRGNRLGTVALRNQTLWDSGALSAVFAPKLARERSAATFSPDLGATNAQSAWLLAVSQRLAPGITPQWLLTQRAGDGLQLGMNLSLELSQRVVALGEWKTGRGPSLLGQFLGSADDALQNQGSAGLTISSAQDITMTFEYQYNSAGLSRRQWRSLGGQPGARAKFLTMAQDLQENPTPHATFALLRWENFMLRKLDLSALAQINLDDRSGMAWLELLYRAGPVDAALQWQASVGGADTAYGMASPRWGCQLLLRRHF